MNNEKLGAETKKLVKFDFQPKLSIFGLVKFNGIFSLHTALIRPDIYIEFRNLSLDIRASGQPAPGEVRTQRHPHPPCQAIIALFPRLHTVLSVCWAYISSQRTWLCKVTPVILHGVVSPELLRPVSTALSRFSWMDSISTSNKFRSNFH